MPELYSRFELDRHGYSIVAVAALDEALTSHPVDRARLTRVARRACGRQVASRSWVAILHFPGAQMASLGPVVLYVARTPGGWRPWYEWTPNFGGRRFIGD